MTKLKTAPSLRFPGFDTVWQDSTIESSKLKIIDGDRGVNYPNGNDFHPIGYCLFLNAKNVTKSGFNFSETIFITKAKDEQLRKGKLTRNDIILTTRGTVANIALFDKSVPFNDLRINSGMVIIRNENTEISQDYLYILLSSSKKRKQLIEISFGSAQPQLTVSQINKLRIEYPSFQEQQKIADFLIAVDTKIQQLISKKALLDKYKKGTMQQIFNQKIRFKDDNGNDYSNWEQKNLSDILTFFPTNSYSRSQLNYVNGEVKNIHYGDIHTKFKSNFDIRKEDVPFLNSEIELSKIPLENYLKEGDLIIADASEDYKDIGKSIEVIRLDNQKIVAGLHTYVARDLRGLTYPGFKGYLMQNYVVRLQIMKLATGSSVLGITKGNLGKIKINIPSVKEQKKIVEFLTAIDVKIKFIEVQLEKVQTFKKGLLQQMFI
jgi:type I restriction enzyme S subunit